MTDARLRGVAAGSLIVGALLGMAGTFAPTAGFRGVAWGIDGILLVVGCALLAVHHVRRGDELLAAGFLVFVAGETLIVSGSAMTIESSAPVFAAGAGLWSASLLLVSASSLMPLGIRATGATAALLFGATALSILGGAPLTPLSQPLPYFAYPLLVITLFGWAWVHAKPASRPGAGGAGGGSS